jgi:glycosyltransferase involved in cell wall biosynthesis
MVRSLGHGGTERQVTEFARSLDRTRFQVHVGCFEDGGFRADELRAEGVPVFRMAMHSFLSADTPRAFSKLRKYVRANRICLVHTFDHPMNVFGIPAARALRVPVVLGSQRSHRDLIPSKYLPIIRLGDRLADGIVVNCEAVRQHLIADYAVPADRIHVCYNTLDTQRFAAGLRSRPEELMQASLVIGSVSVLRAVKDVPTLVDAFAAIHGRFPGLRLAIVGDGPEREKIEARLDALGIRGKTVLASSTSHVEKWLRGIDVFVIPSLTEGLSNSLMEAMACGCAVVASRTGGNPELVRHLETGLLFTPGDVEDLARQLSIFLESPETRARVSAEASRFIHQNFSRDVSSARMAEIYEIYLRKKL